MPNKISVKTFYDNYLVSGSKAGLMANEWQVYIPDVAQTSGMQAKLDFYVNTVKLPNLELIEVTKEYRGRSFAAPAGFKYTGDVTFEVNLDSDLTIYSYFAGLISAISPLAQVSGTGNIGDGDGTSAVTTADEILGSGFIWPATWTPDATTSTIQIKLGPDAVQVSGAAAPTVGGVYTLHGAFPTEISGIEFTNGTPEIASYSVTLAYAYFEYQSGQVSA